MNNAVLYDMTEFLRQPLRTGIQRVVYEIVRSWPESVPLIPVYLQPNGHFLELDQNVFADMHRFFNASAAESALGLDSLRNAPQNPVRVLSIASLQTYRAIFVPEVFFETQRVRYYFTLQAAGVGRVFFLLYDCLPWLHPEWFSPGAISGTMDYIHLLTVSPRRAYISNATRQYFQTRVFRQPENLSEPVVPLGCDWVAADPPVYNQSRCFAVVGTLEPRKNLLQVLDAFEQLWKDSTEVSLCLIGRAGWLAQSDLQRVRDLAQTEARFRWISSATDQDLVETLLTCRATIYPSLGEGFGLPPLESLYLGLPVIVSEDIPSIQMIEPWGQIRLPTPNASSIRQAVMDILDEQVYQKLLAEMKQLNLPRWNQVGPKLCQWILDSTNSVQSETIA